MEKKFFLPDNFWNLLSYFWKNYVSSYLKLLFLGLFLLIVVAVCGGFVVYSMKTIINDVFFHFNKNKLIYVCLLLFFVYSFKSISMFCSEVIKGYITHKINMRLQKKIYDCYLSMDIMSVYKKKSGQFVTNMNQDIMLLNKAMIQTPIDFIQHFSQILAYLYVMFSMDYILTIASFIYIPFIFIPFTKISARIRGVSLTIQNFTSNLTTFITQTFHNLRFIKSYNLEEYESDVVNKHVKGIFKSNYNLVKLRSIPHPMVEFFCGITIIIILIYGSYMIGQGIQDPGSLMTFIISLVVAYTPIKSIVKLVSQFQENFAGMTRIYDCINSKPKVVDLPNAKYFNIIDGVISFENVNFAYNSGVDVLKNISFTLPKRKKIAFVGPSGAGKSTLFHLILRFFDPQEGRILIDGHAIRDFTTESLRSQISLVSQEVVLFNDTIFKNIVVGKLDSSLEEVKAISKKVGIHEFIEKLPNGYNTHVGERGMIFSGGQRQRITLARAMLKNSPIILLDEPTSSLDSKSEEEFQSLLNMYEKDKTVLIIAHRISTIMDSNQIYFLFDGRIHDIGTHEELFKNNDIYRNFCKLQFAVGKND